MTVRARRLRWIGAALAAALALVALALHELLAPLPAPSYASVRAAWRPSEAVLVDRNDVPLDVERRDFRVRRMGWVPLSSVSPALVDAVIAGEDRRFRAHGGVDWLAVAGAARDTLFGRARRGASTITMQLASLLERGAGRERTLARKLHQARLARGIEAGWSKEQILEAYLNLLQFRGELQGIGAAAQVLAGKSPDGLSRRESEVLAALLPNPTAAPSVVAARACARGSVGSGTGTGTGAGEGASPGVPASADRCADYVRTAHALLARADRPAPPARLAPQLARALLREPGSRVATTLDAHIQRLAADALSRQLASLANRNVRDGAVLVVDNASGDVLAYVGSAGPLSRAAEVDGVRAPRQAGSTLKPFLYGLALERGYLTAASLLDDSPIDLDTATGAYVPENYDHRSKGLVSVRTALGSSLNVPAVRALVLVGVEDFRDRLRALGYDRLVEAGSYYGYSLALGSAEVTLWQQAQAYRTLALGGAAAPIHVQRAVAPAATGSATPARVLPEDASFVIGDILADKAARVATFGLDSHLNTPFWSAVKTGTSKDMRDNWCVGYTRRYTVAVWVGNFEGDSMHEVSGVTGAAPVWREIVGALHEELPSTAPAPPAGVVQRAVSFHPALEAARPEWFVANPDPTPTRVVAAAASGAALARVASPANGMIIALDPDIPPRLQRVALAADGEVAGLRLRLDRELVAAADRPLLWAPSAGAHVLELEDVAGRTVDRVVFTVR